MNDSLVLLDGNNSAFRSAAVLNLTNVKGDSVSVPFGMLQSIQYLIKTLRPKEFIVVWDGGKAEFRKSLCPEYKQSKSREKNKDRSMFDDIYKHMEMTQQLLTLLGVPQIKVKGMEADDIIAHETVDSEDPVIVVSSDKDFYQLIDETVSVFNPIKQVMITPENFQEITGFEFAVENYIEYAILTGDKSDNLPGISGVGPKTAGPLVREFKTIPRIKRKLNHNRDMFNNRELKILSDEGHEAIMINRAMMDFDIMFENIQSLDNMRNQLSSDYKADYKAFKKRIKQKDLRFNQILSDYNFWAAPFRKLSVRRKLRNG